MLERLFAVERGESGRIDFSTPSKKQPIGLLIAYIVGLFILFLLLLARLFQLTVVKGAYYRLLADQNRVREVVIESERGQLLDRKGIILVRNEAVDLQKEVERFTSRRIYLQPEVFAHLIGYRQIADRQDLELDTCLNKLKIGDKIGKKGIEKAFECRLRGVAGKKLIEVDAYGRQLKTLGVVEPQAGESLRLAVDSYLQQAAYEQIQQHKAVVVAVKPTTGEVLVLVSSPSFDPQVFEDGKVELMKKYLADDNKPLFNRATEGVYPPGSTFKPFVAVGGLEEKLVTPDTQFEDKGFLQAGHLVFHNWYYLQYGKTDGQVDIIKAIQRSNDIYFYQLGSRLGPERLKKWAEEFGFQRRTGIGIEEAEGTIPSPFWKEDVLKERWYLGDTYNLSIGQGYVLVTPLQLTLATAAIANGGYWCQPQLLRQPVGSDKTIANHCQPLNLNIKTLNAVREGMKRACQTGGTGWPFFDFRVKDTGNLSTTTALPANESTTSAELGKRSMKSVEVGCKTGTAESHSSSARPHAWFTVFAPFNNPEIVLTVLVEEGGQGSDVAAPIAKKILQAYFERNE